MTLSKTHVVLAGILFLLGLTYIGFQAQQVQGEAFTGQISQIDSATTTTVGPDGNQGGNAVTLFSKGTDCDGRAITVPGGAGIMISFSDSLSRPQNISSTTLSASIGHYQAGSTTVMYDSGLYGCGRVTAWAWSSTTLTVSEF